MLLSIEEMGRVAAGLSVHASGAHTAPRRRRGVWSPPPCVGGTGGSVPDPRRRAEVIELANLEIRPSEFEVLADGTGVGLTVREFQTFLVLAGRPDRVVTRPEIYALVWGGQMTYRDRADEPIARAFAETDLVPVGQPVPPAGAGKTL